VEALNTLDQRLIPKLQLRASSFDPALMVLVTTVNFEKTIEIGNPTSQAKIFDSQSADELVFLDIDASNENRVSLVNIVQEVSKSLFIPLTIGGGIKSIDDIILLLSNGADKVSINSSAIKNPEFINSAANRFGTSTIVISIDYKKNLSGKYTVWTNGGKYDTGKDPIDWSIECASRGAGELMICSINNDGTQNGLDLEITRKIVDSVSIPVITSGGCGSTDDFINGYKVGCAHAVAAGTYFCFNDQGFMQIRAHIKNAGIPIRIVT